ncbi:hypothetical protein [Psychrobacter sanguinis]|uniref:hypothetical protein n=1 Tax=Psychrobacter sanguinis TaxID=861445 RepID=UPI00020C7983|nr:hypothetical protein [Psychrobacter sanguinis]EGK14787.1 hypothetical protein HMPREF9373_0619 [Psychrobacter sp. 1501(2011)]MCD9150996.1 hypothetical protein [Psychrobacter sanguinis]
MSDKIIDLGSGFWNIQGTFKIGGLINIGTQCSLVKLDSGRFIFLDSYTLTDEIRDEVMSLTNNGDDVEAILNLHPFHTIHCAQMAKDFPKATVYGSERHKIKVPEVDWAEDLVESKAVAERYPELEFSLPKGIYYISPNEMVHASSLLAYHPASKTLHVDDTFVTPPAKILQAVMPELGIHPTTKKALTDQPTAGRDYCDWAENLAEKWQDIRHVCAAHSDVIHFEAGGFKAALLKAIEKARPKLENA